MKNIAFYHAYLTDDPGTWVNMVIEQFKCMEDSKLLKCLDELNISCISKNDDRIRLFDELIRLYYPNAKIDYYQNPFSSDEEMLSNINRSTDNLQIPTENITKQKIYKRSFDEEAFILYFHTKGITSITKHLKFGQMHLLRNYQYWRYYLNWGVLENWESCLSGLHHENADVAGVNFMDHPSPHFSGNFWWSRSEHIRKLPDPSTIDWFLELQKKTNDNWFRNAPLRFRDEQWICSIPNTKVFKVVDIDPNKNPAGTYLPKSEYFSQ